MKQVRLIKIRLNEAHTFPIQDGLKQGYALALLLFNFGLE
jgi:hypothetical protein